MVSPRQRSNSYKVRNRKTPSGKASEIQKEGKPSPATCALTGTKLHAVPRRKTGEMSKLSKTQKRPERMFGGVLSHKILKTLIKEKVRLEEGYISESDVKPSHMQYIKMMRK